MPDFTIIIPIYNAERTLTACLDSIHKQTQQSFEVLLIDDGSKDASKKICEQYMEQDTRFRYIYQDNSGPSAARNKGLEMASGAFVAFVDSDDSVEPDYLECLSAAFSEYEADAVFIGYAVLSPAGDKMGESIPEKYSDNYLEQLAALSAHDLFGYTWVKAFRRAAIREKRFREDISLFEDEIFACDVLKHCTRVGIVPQPVYHYTRDSVNTLMGKTRKDYVALQEQVYAAWQWLTEYSDNQDKWLQQRANALAINCEYYYLEREVPENEFLQALKSAVFIRECSIHDSFYEAVRGERWGQLKMMRQKYRMKTAISKLLRGRGKM